ncbi:MAG: DUF2029 domain-containing protein [Solirubrobacterales bacterium]|nr:DUF2029 domain-containing protein [Solirubrobacterales bacterium]
MRTALVPIAILAALALAPPASAAPDPADQPPFGGAPLPPPVEHSGHSAPVGFRLAPVEAITIADHTPEVFEQRQQRELEPVAATRGDDRWEVTYYDSGGVPRALVVLDDSGGAVLEAWTGHQVETRLARGYGGAVSGNVNEAWFWLPLCLLFLAPFFDPKRPFRLLHLDLLALLSLSASLFFFNRGEIDVSVPLVYPVLGYLFARMLMAGFRPFESRDRLLPVVSRTWLIVGIVALIAVRVAFQASDGKVIDVGLAGVIGADRLAAGEDVYGEGASEGLPIRGDVYGPVTYIVYLPFERALPWSGQWDDVPPARYAALGFDLLTALSLLWLGRRLRPGEEGATLGVALSFAWLAYPFTIYTLGSSFNDSLVALLLVLTLCVFASAPARGALAALAGLTKFGPLALAPLFAAGRGDRSPRSVLAFAIPFALVAIAVTVPLLPDGGVSELYDRSFGYQASRGSPFSIWGLAPSLDPLQSAVKAFAALFALALFFVPRRRSPVQVAALAAAAIIAVQVAATHWFYPYAVWFAPLVLAALFAAQRGPEAEVRPLGTQVSG